MRPLLIGLGSVLAVLLVAGVVATIFESAETRLSSRDTLTVARANLAFAHTVLDGSRKSQTDRGVDDLITLCRRNPDAIYRVGDDPDRTMRQVLEDAAIDLRRFQPDLSERLKTVSDNGCR